MTSNGLEVFVEAPARLHFGVLDLRGELGRWFGGIGAAAPEATLLVSVSRALTVTAHGQDAQRAAGFAKRFLEHHHIREGARVCVHRSLPRHAGLGSGTQLALSVARALAELYGVDTDPPTLAQAVGRARRSAIGTWIFSGGGLVVEGGRHTGFDNCGPLIARVPFPPAWRCVVAIPGGKGLSGVREEEAFYRLPMPRQEEVERVAHLVLLLLLPSVVEADLSNFGRALSQIQEITGRWFAAVQGSTFAKGVSEELVHRMREWRALGVGQSSWGPAVYGIVGRDDDAQRLADRARDFIGSEGVVYAGPFRGEGARVWTREAATTTPPIEDSRTS